METDDNRYCTDHVQSLLIEPLWNGNGSPARRRWRRVWSSNRTIVEWKLCEQIFEPKHNQTSNRTIVEWKHLIFAHDKSLIRGF